MKWNIFLSLIGVAIACLTGYLIFNIAEGKEYDVFCGIGSTVCFAMTLVPVVGVHYECVRLGINLRVLAALFFFLFLVSQLCFAVFGIELSNYLIVNGLLLLVYLLVFYKLQEIKNV